MPLTTSAAACNAIAKFTKAHACEPHTQPEQLFYGVVPADVCIQMCVCAQVCIHIHNLCSVCNTRDRTHIKQSSSRAHWRSARVGGVRASRSHLSALKCVRMRVEQVRKLIITPEHISSSRSRATRAFAHTRIKHTYEYCK